MPEEKTKMKTEKVNSFRAASLWKVTKEDGHWFYRLMWKDQLVCEDRARRYLQEIMYQIG